QRGIEVGERIVVGVNRFEQDDAGGISSFRLDPALESVQVERLRQVRASRSQSAVDEKLAILGQAARDGSNLMPVIVAAAEAHATVGEISDCLREVFGEYREA